MAKEINLKLTEAEATILMGSMLIKKDGLNTLKNSSPEHREYCEDELTKLETVFDKVGQASGFNRT